MDYLDLIYLLVFGFIGHTALWVSIVNRANSYAIPHGLLRWLNRTCLFICAFVPLAFAVSWLVTMWRVPTALGSHAWAARVWLAVLIYLWLCILVGSWAVIIWLMRHARRDDAQTLVLAQHSQHYNVAKLGDKSLAGNWKAGLCALIPGNQIFQFQVEAKELTLPGLPPALDGFTIAHLSDLHFAGHIRREFHEEVMRQTNLLDADLIAITGDIIDRPQCLDWFASTLGQLRARQGVYFILGNHDSRRALPDDVRRALVALGLVDLGGQHAIIEHNGTRVLITGNELPWHKAPPEICELSLTPSTDDALSILLSHSPDQLFRAQREGYKLMLAGHVHGGQIRPPLIGPILSPSRYGTRYASGLFYQPPTLLHVTRGTSAMIPLRFFCPPEVAKLVLRCGA